MDPKLEPAFHVDFDFSGKGWEVWSVDHDKEVMVARYEYQVRNPVPGRSVRLVDPAGRVLFTHLTAAKK